MIARDDDRQIRLQLMRELKFIYDNKDFVCGVTSIAGSGEIWQELLDYIYLVRKDGEEVSSDNIQLLALALRREADEERLRMELEKIPDSNEDFVTGIIRIAEKYAETERIMDYLHNHPKAKISDVTDYVFSGKTESVNQNASAKKWIAAPML